MKILVVEDEERVAHFIQKGLKEEGHAVDVSYDGEDGEFLAEVNDYDLIILDLMLPKKNGIVVCRELRASGVSTPVLMLTARDSVEDKVRGLDAGADDYLAKPFAFEELLARVRALLRRKSESKSPILKVGDLELDPISRRVSREGSSIRLTTKEYALLEYLMRNPGKVLSRTLIGEHVWDMNFDPESNVIDVYISHLRSKIDKGFEQQLLHTLRGQGYLLTDDTPPA
ncbi:response regulator [Mariprofundus erugo]|uniref:Response regulator n=1 Tax=Mariprofundus erugo TaxID=2528639 RepID=A0A5R9H185_9PROT|nr:heavy metal response regulator transcription factor [Mariprofundus erugo]TLS68684.1 response regulator [Mariprofundus erugo]TLS77623.1 response regulator [Mariprofundus erugo]